MNKNRYIFRFLLVMISILLTMQGIYAQKEGTKRPDENALRHSFQHPQKWKGLRFSEPRTFIERSYFSVGMSISEVWGISDVLDGSTVGTNSTVSFGHWIAPIHGLELNLGIGVLPYALWEVDNQNQADYSPQITKHWSMGLTYMLNITSYASKIEESKRWELIGLIGASLKRYDKFSIEANIGMRLKYNFTPGIGAYLEPSISLFNKKIDSESRSKLSVQVAPSISAGLSIRLSQIYEYNKQQKESDTPDNTKETSPSLNIKTNILYWIPLAPNIGLEYRFRKPWSIGASASTAWWKNEATHKYYQLGIYELEGRYYLGKRRNHHLGVYAQAGMYDLEFKDIGRIGEFFGVGISYGYLLPINDRFSLDFDIGFGYTNASYKEYQYAEKDNAYEYLQSKLTHLFMPSKVGVSVIWNIPLYKKQGGTQ